MGELMLQNPAVQVALNPIKLYARVVGRKWSLRFPHRMIKNYYVWSVLKSRDLLCERRDASNIIHLRVMAFSGQIS